MRVKQKDYYQILGVPRNATDDEIRKAYRKHALEYHPDRNPGKEEWATKKFKEINEAFSVLGNPEKRRQYDQWGTVEGGANLGDIFSHSSTQGTFEDLMRDFQSSGLGSDFLNGIFRDFLGGNSFRRTHAKKRRFINLNQMFGHKAQDIKYELTVTREESVKGVKKILVRDGKRLEVKVPPGVKAGSLVRLRNALMTTDGKPGDILIQIKIK
jgi:curved DNA-binding protein